MNNNILTLQEKMAEIRSEIPALIKRAYSEEVNYDFTKIDDIFRYLTPAMNRWKVNLEIVSEKATKKREDGTPNYLEFLNYRQIWLYEADLELWWINAENPEEVSPATIHAIGTHEMPEKAKGSAWTYALKYYLLNKYCIDQGGEDPDMRDFPPDSHEYIPGEYEGGQLGHYGLDNDLSTETASTAAKADVEMEEEAGNAEYLDEDSEQEETTQAEACGPEEFSDTDEEDSTDVKETDAGGVASENVRQEPVKTENNGSGRPNPSSHIMPESGKMVTLPNGVSPQPSVHMTMMDAKNVVCTFGIYNNQRLGDMMEMGDEGIKALEWIAYDYRGRQDTIRQAARVLLKTLQAA